MSRYTFFLESKLSNWHIHKFSVWGIEFECGEAAMMAAKALLFGDKVIYEQIMQCQTNPKEIQTLGRQIKNFDQTVWDLNKREIMYCISYARFSQTDYLHDKLMATAGTLLVEASPTDFVWGIGLSIEDAKGTHESQWKGQNLLGKCFTQVRDDMVGLGHRFSEYNPSTNPISPVIPVQTDI